MDVQFDRALGAGRTSESFAQRATRATLWYWGISLLFGIPLLWDWLGAWNVAATWANPWLVAYLIVTFAIGQGLYFLVARHDGRPFQLGPTVIFGIGNGILETLAFAVTYRVGEIIGSTLVGWFAPAWASGAGFALGVVLFVIYGGLIHGLFWLKILPPHLDDAPRSRQIRKFRPAAEIALVLGWSICLWVTRDIWTVIFFHTLVDIGLMLRVRPPLFQNPE